MTRWIWRLLLLLITNVSFAQHNSIHEQYKGKIVFLSQKTEETSSISTFELKESSILLALYYASNAIDEVISSAHYYSTFSICKYIK